MLAPADGLAAGLREKPFLYYSHIGFSFTVIRFFSRPYTNSRAYATVRVASVCRLSVCNVGLYCG